MQAIDIGHVTLERDGTGVFSDLTLRLTERRIGIVGRNGAGKSSLIRLITGLVAPQKGRVVVNGVDVAADRAGALGTVGLLFQNPDHQIIFPVVRDEIAFGLEQKGLKRAAALARAEAVLAAQGRADWGDRLCHTLSQGAAPAFVPDVDPGDGAGLDPVRRALQRAGPAHGAVDRGADRGAGAECRSGDA
ncbi:ATP-binding cassette domain-containing protein [Rhodobacter capsulatus]|uniref:ATP-binding cassette domain-containing protein n=1 Tax=Rhodobacter capsulatus TaxID=1061 RepID=UPI0040387B0B